MNVISWDYDDTLYDWKNKKIIEKTAKIFYEEAKSNKVVITTYRNKRCLRDIHKNFPNVNVWATNGGDKTDMLIRRGVIRHYDDDILLCRELMGTSCEPVYICYDEELTKNGFIPAGLKYIEMWE